MNVENNGQPNRDGNQNEDVRPVVDEDVNLTAFALGEISDPAEADRLKKLLEKDAAKRKEFETTVQLAGLIRDSVENDLPMAPGSIHDVVLAQLDSSSEGSNKHSNTQQTIAQKIVDDSLNEVTPQNPDASKPTVSEAPQWWSNRTITLVSSIAAMLMLIVGILQYQKWNSETDRTAQYDGPSANEESRSTAEADKAVGSGESEEALSSKSGNKVRSMKNSATGMADGQIAADEGGVSNGGVSSSGVLQADELQEKSMLKQQVQNRARNSQADPANLPQFQQAELKDQATNRKATDRQPKKSTMSNSARTASAPDSASAPRSALIPTANAGQSGGRGGESGTKKAQSRLRPGANGAGGQSQFGSGAGGSASGGGFGGAGGSNKDGGLSRTQNNAFGGGPGGGGGGFGGGNFGGGGSKTADPKAMPKSGIASSNNESESSPADPAKRMFRSNQEKLSKSRNSGSAAPANASKKEAFNSSDGAGALRGGGGGLGGRGSLAESGKKTEDGKAKGAARPRKAAPLNAPSPSRKVSRGKTNSAKQDAPFAPQNRLAANNDVDQDASASDSKYQRGSEKPGLMNDPVQKYVDQEQTDKTIQSLEMKKKSKVDSKKIAGFKSEEKGESLDSFDSKQGRFGQNGQQANSKNEKEDDHPDPQNPSADRQESPQEAADLADDSRSDTKEPQPEKANSSPRTEADQLDQIELEKVRRIDPALENPFVQPVGSDALSSFATDTDSASYITIRQKLRAGELPHPEEVRIEEMVNYFNYNYPQPTGNERFAVHMELASSPWSPGNKILKIGLQAKKLDNQSRPPSNLVFLIDVSGSMHDRKKLPLLKSALKKLVTQLREDDYVSIVTYAEKTTKVLEPTDGSQKEKINAVIDGLRAQGGTKASEGLKIAYQYAEEHFREGGTNRIIFGTDGDFNMGITDTTKLTQFVKKKAQSGIYLTICGFGVKKFDDQRMQTAAQNSNGNVYFIDNESEAQRVFVERISGLVTIAKDVKVQLVFNPRTVQSYRLIGYENRTLTASEFENHRTDAGEMGAGDSVTVLYEIVPGDGKFTFPTTVKIPREDILKYQRIQPKKYELTKLAESEDIAALRVHYKEPNAKLNDDSIKREFVIKNNSTTFNRASQDFQLATAVTGLGLMLRGSQHRGTLNFAGLKEFGQSVLTDRKSSAERSTSDAQEEDESKRVQDNEINDDKNRAKLNASRETIRKMEQRMEILELIDRAANLYQNRE